MALSLYGVQTPMVLPKMTLGFWKQLRSLNPTSMRCSSHTTSRRRMKCDSQFISLPGYPQSSSHSDNISIFSIHFDTEFDTVGPSQSVVELKVGGGCPAVHLFLVSLVSSRSQSKPALHHNSCKESSWLKDRLKHFLVPTSPTAMFCVTISLCFLLLIG